MIAKFTGSNTNGNLAGVHTNGTGTLVDLSGIEVAATDARFIIVKAGSSGALDSLVMWLKGESF